MTESNMIETKLRAIVPVNTDGPKTMEYFDLSKQDDLNRLSYADYDASKLMQYTGLKDRNGKEIYEGDIVKLHDHPTGIDDCITEVVYSAGAFVAKYNGIRIGDYGTAWTEVIGNIHENPDLLK